MAGAGAVARSGSRVRQCCKAASRVRENRAAGRAARPEAAVIKIRSGFLRRAGCPRTSLAAKSSGHALARLVRPRTVLSDPRSLTLCRLTDSAAESPSSYGQSEACAQAGP